MGTLSLTSEPRIALIFWGSCGKSLNINVEKLSSAPPEVIALVERASRVPDRHGDLVGIWTWCRRKHE